jgi:PilZ domain-containing protein
MDEQTSEMLRAVIRTEHNSFLTDCVIRNLSASGAKLLIEAKQVLPSEFVIFLRPNSPVGRRCQIMWRIGDTVAVRFISVHMDKSPYQGSGVWAPS